MKNSKSVVFKRQQALLKELREEKTIDVETVAQKLNVSPTTIRRDLVMFEKQNLIERFHGGATLLEESLREEDNPTDNREAEDKEQKHIIARYAAELVEDGDTIFINSSSTALLMLDYLKGKNVIVVTNNGFAVGHPHDPQVEIIMTGGEIPTMAIVDSIVRLIPGVLGGETSAEIESFSDGDNYEYPQYTRPAEFRGMKVPEVLLNGNHAEIAKWRAENAPKAPQE